MQNVLITPSLFTVIVSFASVSVQLFVSNYLNIVVALQNIDNAFLVKSILF